LKTVAVNLCQPMPSIPSRMRVTVTLPEEVHQALSEWAEEEDRTLANLLSHVAAKAVRDRQEQKKEESKSDRP
jgi:CopG-like RHH_1 or ribbon-helix-helix domain, RHH_5